MLSCLPTYDTITNWSARSDSEHGGAGGLTLLSLGWQWRHTSQVHWRTRPDRKRKLSREGRLSGEAGKLRYIHGKPSTKTCGQRYALKLMHADGQWQTDGRYFVRSTAVSCLPECFPPGWEASPWRQRIHRQRDDDERRPEQEQPTRRWPEIDQGRN